MGGSDPGFPGPFTAGQTTTEKLGICGAGRGERGACQDVGPGVDVGGWDKRVLDFSGASAGGEGAPGGGRDRAGGA